MSLADVETALRAGELARDMPQAEVDEVAFGMARKRAETDLRLAAVREVKKGPTFEARARHDGHPGYMKKADVEAWKAIVAKGMRRLHREEPLPTEIETRVARAVVATHGTARHELALAMAGALERGTPGTADGIRTERETLLADLGRSRALSPTREREILWRVYASFTGADIRRICEGRGAVLENLADGRRGRG